MSSLLQNLAYMPQPQLHQQIQNQATPVQNQAPAQPQLGVPPTPTSVQSKPAVLEESMFKNRLQEYTQKACIPLPVYKTINEAMPHAPEFRSTVVVNGVSYTSPNVFSQRRAAEIDVSRIALESLAPHVVKGNCSLHQEDHYFFKTILKEYADKISIENPIYKTEKTDDFPPVFVTSLTFNGKHYVGDEGRNKKVSQQLAARAVIMSILDSDARVVISKIINSKKMLSAAKGKVKNPCNTHNVVMPEGIQTQSNVGTSASKGNELQVAIVNGNMPKTAISEPCSGTTSDVSAKPGSLHEFRIPKQEPILVEANATPIIFVPPNSEQPVVGSTSSKKRKRKTKKAQNKVENDAQVQVAAVSSSQTITSTVAGSVPNNCASLQGSDNAVLSGA